MWTFQSSGLEDGMMDSDADGGAINLSQRPSAANSPSESYDFDEIEQRGSGGVLVKEEKKSQSVKKSKKSNGHLSSSSPSPPTSVPFPPGTNGDSTPLGFPPNVHQIQQLIQQHLLSPNQIHSLLHHHSLLFQQQQHHQLAEIGRKQLEQAIQNLQEQLQVNLVQQSHIMESGGDKKKCSGALNQLRAQQQGLMQQLQLSQRQYLIQQQLNFPNLPSQHNGEENNHKNWKMEKLESHDGSPSPLSTSHQNGNSPKHQSNGVSGRREILNGVDNVKIEQFDKSPLSQQHPLYGHGVCKWPGCETVCEEFHNFMKHMRTEHVLDDRSTAQARVQMQVVSQLEIQLAKERDRLQAMMTHLHMAKEGEKNNNKNPNSLLRNAPILPPSNPLPPSPQEKPPLSEHSVSNYEENGNGLLNGCGVSKLMSLNSSFFLPDLSSHPPFPQPPLSTRPSPHHPPPPHGAKGHERRRISDKHNPLHHLPGFDDIGPTRRRVGGDRSTLQICEGLPYLLERAGLDVASEIQRNREFYKVTDCRPPFTYASLIRQAIIESPDKQLTLNEIYNWFQNTFCYFRRNQATWKNAIRTNLSLHRDDFGSFWTVNQLEFDRKRHLSRGRPRKYEPSNSPPPPSSAHGMQSKSPNQSPTLYGDSLNASLQAALSESNVPFMRNILSPDHATSPLEARSLSPGSMKREGLSDEECDDEILMKKRSCYDMNENSFENEEEIEDEEDIVTKNEDLAQDLSNYSASYPNSLGNNNNNNSSHNINDSQYS